MFLRRMINETSTRIKKMLIQIDGQKYGAYKRTKGMYQFDDFRLAIDHVQVDPLRRLQK